MNASVRAGAAPPPYVVVKRHTWSARIDRDRPKSQRRRRPDEDSARRLLGTWSADPDVKAVWLYAPDGTLLHHETFDRSPSTPTVPTA